MLLKETQPPPNLHNSRMAPARVRKLGFGLLCLLVINLPFELTQSPLLTIGSWVSLSNLEILFYATVLAGMAAIALEPRSFFEPGQKIWRLPGFWLGLGLLGCLVSSFLGVALKESLKFCVYLVLGGILWLAVPLWLKENREARLRWLIAGLVAGGSLSAGLGLLEFVPGLKINSGLLAPFKPGATIAGPLLRLSGTFEYANIAAAYYELVLPFGLAGLTGAVKALLQPQTNPLKKPGWQLWVRAGLWLVACGLLWEGLILSFSRAAWPGMLVAAPLLGWIISRKATRSMWIGLGIGFGLGLGLAGLTGLLSPTLVLRLKSESDQQWYRAEYSASLPATLTACSEATVTVMVHNLTPLDWEGGADGQYQLAYHWLDRPDHVYLFEGVRSVLPSRIAAGATAPVMAKLIAPAKPGSYGLVWDIIQKENNNWFSLKSAQYHAQPVEITASNTVTCQESVPTDPAALAPPDNLPTTPPNPERSQLWKIALKMIAARPLLGVGPDGYRFAYGEYAGQQNWDKRIFANSTPLELTADLGIPTFLCLVLFVAILLGPLLVRAWRRSLNLAEAPILTALVAFGLHGLLDYFLGFHAIFMLFWLLLGLAATLKTLPEVVTTAGSIPDQTKMAQDEQR